MTGNTPSLRSLAVSRGSPLPKLAVSKGSPLPKLAVSKGSPLPKLVVFSLPRTSNVATQWPPGVGYPTSDF